MGGEDTRPVAPTNFRTLQVISGTTLAGGPGPAAGGTHRLAPPFIHSPNNVANDYPMVGARTGGTGQVGQPRLPTPLLLPTNHPNNRPPVGIFCPRRAQ
jgi:hypothetical protein